MNDSVYRRAVETYRAALPAGHTGEIALTDCDRLGVPCHSVIFYPIDGPHKGGIGYGATQAQARCGAFGELTEDLRAHQALESWPRVRGSYARLVAERGAPRVTDPLTLCLEAGMDYSPDVELEWVEIARFGEQNRLDERVLVPVEFVACGWSDLTTAGNAQLGEARRGRLVTPITNGLGAGVDFDQALTHGILELLQRDGNGLSIRALATGVALDVATVSDPLARDLLARFDAAGVDVTVKIASTERGMTSFYVCGLDRDARGGGARSGGAAVMALAGGEAVHPDARVALRKALLEFAASRARIAFFHGPLEIAERVAPPGYLSGFRANFRPEDEEARGLQSMSEWSQLTLAQARQRLLARVQRVDSRLDFASLPSREIENKAELLRFLLELLRAEGLDVLVADFSDPARGVWAVKALVPGLEVETLSYGRIGARNVTRLIQSANAGGPILASVGTAPRGAKPVLLTSQAQEKLGGAAWFDADAVATLVNPLYSLYREPGRHAAALWAEMARNSG